MVLQHKIYGMNNLQMYELTDIMRQKEKAFSEQLNRLREGNHTA